MLKAITKLFDSNQKTLDRYQEIVDKINELEPSVKDLSDKQLKAKTQEFQERLEKNETLDDILPEAFATVREAAMRTLGMRHYDVQLMAAIAFHQGKVAEQKTGEGKTLSATAALYLNALEGKGAHLVTVNDYLAQRDAGWMAPLFHFLGLTTAVIYSGQGDQPASLYDPEYKGKDRGDERLEHLKPVTRNEAYAADITYGTNNEFGFDYLRDNMAQSLDQMSQRGHNYAIVDEVDSILIDEARTPLIISAPDTEPTSKYYEFAKLVDSLQKEIDYAIDEKARTATLTDYGVRRLEKRLNVSNLYEEDFDTIHHVEQALKAKTLFQRDKDYVVKDGQVIIVDEHTGRLMFGRRYSEGLHQAIEAKENVTIQQESRTLATISLQNYFRMYAKLSGMTGTAATEAEEFQEIYGMDVVVIPTNRPIARKDHSDVVYKTKRAKFGAIVKEVREKYEQGQPVLIGTPNIDQNQILSRYLKRVKIPHEVLNAKNHEQEALIIANAGKPKAVTVATNIAGRGVDIVLGGAVPEKPGKDADKKTKESFEKAKKTWEEQNKQALENGGLHVIGAERHNARRIDNQLRGRSGRQGDPGSSRFFVSLEDDIMRIFGGEQVSKLMDMLKIPEDQPIESGMVSNSIQQAQQKVEGFHFDQRKRVVDYDDVMNKQREIIYKRRQKLLEQSDSDNENVLRESIQEIVDNYIQATVITHFADTLNEDTYQAILRDFLTLIPFDKGSQEKILSEISQESDSSSIIETLQDIAHKTYEDRVENMGPEATAQIERYVMLNSIDKMWMDHLDAMDDLREGIWLRGGKDQVISEYKKEAFDMFAKLLELIDEEVARTIFRVNITRVPETTLPDNAFAGKDDDFLETPQEAPPATTTRPQGTGALAAALQKTAGQSGSDDGRNPVFKKVVSTQEKPGRNDPCPCGSGKKWKKCHYPDVPASA